MKCGGDDLSVEYGLDYQAYDKMDLRDAFNLGVIFIDLNEFLWDEQNWFVRANCERISNDYRCESSCFTLENVIERWRNNEISIRMGFKEVEDKILSALDDLEYKVVFDYNFEEFLDEIELDPHPNGIKISSIYSSYIAFTTKDDLTNGVGHYIERLVDRNDIKLCGMFVWEAEFALKLSEKYGEDIFDCNEDEE